MSFWDEKDIFKLMNNDTFGKTIADLRKKIEIRLVHNAKKHKSY